ncbi:MAG: SAM-dependent methyltransferase [Verrucomicrobia bacterium]|nr:SAM-dependent methyltransferase [Verrucomicrobiota bacterium]
MLNDNRNYDYSTWDFVDRAEYAVIVDWIPRGATVIDLACGNGSLMKRLRDEKAAKIEGVEIAQSGVDFCRRHGLDARVAPIDVAATYAGYADQQFDFAVCNVTVQMVNYPEVLLAEMKRIARHSIVSFPNFAHYSNRLDLLRRGRMPRPMIFGYDWYSTGHIHHLSLADFRGYCAAHGTAIEREAYVGEPAWLARRWPNLFSVVAICQSGK